MKKMIKKFVPNYIFYRRLMKNIENEQLEEQLELHHDLWDSKKEKKKLIRDCKRCERKYLAYPEGYFDDKLYSKSDSEREKFVTQSKLYCIVKVLNSHKDSVYLRDKSLFCVKFNDFIGRKYLDVCNASLASFRDFLSGKSKIIVKEKDGYCGIGTYVVDIDTFKKDRSDYYEDLYFMLKKNNAFVEEYIYQDGILHDLNPASVNTIRVCTMFIDGKVEVFQCVLNCGNGDMCVDNWNYGGIFAMIDCKSGVVCSKGYHQSGMEYVFHPKSNICLVGLQIPHWEEMIEMIKRAAALIKDVRYVSWDVCISESGKINLIEGNFCGDAQWSYDVGVLPVFESYLRRYGLYDEYKKMVKNYYREPYFATN